jgi:hypothetical protein
MPETFMGAYIYGNKKVNQYSNRVIKNVSIENQVGNKKQLINTNYYSSFE